MDLGYLNVWLVSDYDPLDRTDQSFSAKGKRVSLLHLDSCSFLNERKMHCDVPSSLCCRKLFVGGLDWSTTQGEYYCPINLHIVYTVTLVALK